MPRKSIRCLHFLPDACLKRRAFSEGSVDSILNQLLADSEFIIVNDGRADGTAWTLEEYAAKDPRISAYHQPNGGIVSALNAGLARCQAAYIARMDGDGMCMPNRFCRSSLVRTDSIAQPCKASANADYFSLLA
jgi:hypothetical protein